MDTDEILQGLRAIIAQVRSREGPLAPESISLDSELGKDLLLDSVEFIACLAEMENHFEMVLERADYQNGPMTQVRDLVEIIRRRRAGKTAMEIARNAE